METDTKHTDVWFLELLGFLPILPATSLNEYTQKHRVQHFSAPSICSLRLVSMQRVGALSPSSCLSWKWKVKVKLTQSSLRPHGLYSPWNSPGQNTGVGSLPLQGIFPAQGSNPGLLHCRRILYQLSHQGSPEYEYRKFGLNILKELLSFKVT